MKITRSDRSNMALWWWTIDRYMLTCFFTLIIFGIFLVMAFWPSKRVQFNQKFNANKVTSNNSIIPLYILAYFPQNSGRQISVGMKARILPDNVKANTVGTLRGEVESVYPMPATTNSASSILGSTTCK